MVIDTGRVGVHSRVEAKIAIPVIVITLAFPALFLYYPVFALAGGATLRQRRLL